MQLDRRDIESALRRKGFVHENADHRYFHHEYQGKRTGIHTHTSHGSHYKVYGGPLLRSMKGQLRLDSVAQLGDLVKCPMSQDMYNAHLKGKGLLPEPEKTTEPAAQPGKTQKAPKRRGRR